MKYKKNILVLIKRPKCLAIEDSYDGVYWVSDMEVYNGKTFVTLSDYGDRRYRLRSLEKKYHRVDEWFWHEDWLFPLSVDSNGNPEPIDNQHNEFCYWCKEKTIYFEEFSYCPKCLR